MLSELTLKFKWLSPEVTAAVLAAFVVLAATLSWKRNLAVVVGVAASFGVITALVLMIATRNPLPFAMAILFMALTMESAACRDRWLGLRPIVALSADIAIWAAAEMITPPDGTAIPGPPAAAPFLLTLQLALFLIYGGSIVFRTVVLGRRITFFETGQAVAAFVLASVGVLRSHLPAAATVLAVSCLLCAALCYSAAFGLFDRLPQRRNYRVYATWGAALFIAGIFLYFRSIPLTTVFILASATALSVGVWAARLTLGFHGLAYLLAATITSGLLRFAAQGMAGVIPASIGWNVWITAASTVLCYAIALRFQRQHPNVQLLVLRLLFAVLLTYVAAALSVVLIAMAVSRSAVLGAQPLSVVRTLILCLTALLLGSSGSRWKRKELVWVAYGTIAFGTFKLLFEDLRYGSAGSFAVSLFLYGVVLIVLPRLARSKPAEDQAS